MNGSLLCQGVAGVAADAVDLSFDGQHVLVRELRLRHQAHIQFICGRTLGSLLSDCCLQLDTGACYGLKPPTEFELPSRIHDVPYAVRALRFALLTEEERKGLDWQWVRA